MAQVRMFGTKGQYFSLDEGALDIVIFQYHVFLEAFHGEVVLGTYLLGQHHLEQKLHE